MRNRILEARERCQVFIGPEYFFASDTDQLPKHCSPVSYDEALHVRDVMKRASATARDMLIVPGTFFFLVGGYDPHVFNIAFIYLNGREIAEVSKTQNGADKEYATNSGYSYFISPIQEATAIVSWNDLRVGVQICTDMSIELPEACAFALHPTFNIGAGRLLTMGHRHRPTNRLISDGMGNCYGFTKKGTVKGNGQEEMDCEY